MGDTRLTRNYCEYLSFRSFYSGFPIEQQNLPHVNGVDDAILRIKDALAKSIKPALLLSGGMDSAVLLPYMPEGATAYTIYHDELEYSEVEIAKHYCDKFSVNHVALSIDPKYYFEVIDELMVNKKMPLSPAEPILYLAAKQISRDGFKEIVTGGGADAKFGGFTRFRQPLVSSQYQKKLQKRYLHPENILKKTTLLNYLFDQYLISIPKNKPFQRFFRSLSPGKRGRCFIDSRRFLTEVGVERFAFDNAISLAGCEHIAPFSQFVFDFDEELNLQRPKYFIEDLFLKIYGQDAPKKLGLQKPVHQLADYSPENLELFKNNIDMTKLKYPQKFLIFCLERFEALRLEGKV